MQVLLCLPPPSHIRPSNNPLLLLPLSAWWAGLKSLYNLYPNPPCNPGKISASQWTNGWCRCTKISRSSNPLKSHPSGNNLSGLPHQTEWTTHTCHQCSCGPFVQWTITAGIDHQFKSGPFIGWTITGVEDHNCRR